MFKNNGVAISINAVREGNLLLSLYCLESKRARVFDQPMA